MHEPERAGCKWCGLGRICFPGRFAAAPEAPRKAMHIRRMRVPRGKTLYRSGGQVESLFMIRSGLIKELAESAGGNGAVVGFALPGEILSIQGLCSPVSQTTSIAVEQSHVCVVPWSMARDLCAESPQVAAEFMRLVAAAGIAARDLLMLIRDREAIGRVSGFLLNMQQRLSVHGAGERELRLGMNRDDIANYLGLSSETVSRCFTTLARRELIQVRAKRLRILRPHELRRVFIGG